MYIAISRIPRRRSLKAVTKYLSKFVKHPFEVLNFDVLKGRRGLKTCYVRLLDRWLNPLDVIKKINMTKLGPATVFAYVTQTVPNLQLAKTLRSGGKPVKTSDQVCSDKQVLVTTHNAILVELQSKYAGLYNLSKTTGHQLLTEIAQIIFKRLKIVMDTKAFAAQKCAKLSRCYRNEHPHSEDFQMLVTTLHKIQDEQGIPRASILESELCSYTSHDYVIDMIPYDKVKAACLKYSDQIEKKLTDHIKSFDLEVNEAECDDTPRNTVREELKKFSPYLSAIIKQVLGTHFAPKKYPFHRLQIYGEPSLPVKTYMIPITRGCSAVKVFRSNCIHNLVTLNVPLHTYRSFMAMDGASVGGSKLVIRRADIPLWKVPPSLLNEMLVSNGLEPSVNIADAVEPSGDIAEDIELSADDMEEPSVDIKPSANFDDDLGFDDQNYSDDEQVI